MKLRRRRATMALFWKRTAASGQDEQIIIWREVQRNHSGGLEQNTGKKGSTVLQYKAEGHKGSFSDENWDEEDIFPPVWSDFSLDYSVRTRQF